jgi:hypothetical protein
MTHVDIDFQTAMDRFSSELHDIAKKVTMANQQLLLLCNEIDLKRRQRNR